MLAKRKSWLIALPLFPALAFSAQSNQTQPGGSPGASAADVILTVHIGQVIPLTLSFKSAKPDAYQIDPGAKY
jgi:hypothetical protein